MDKPLDKNVIILIIIVGVAFCIAMGYGMHRALSSRSTESGYIVKFNERNAEQDQYMVDLRMAHRDALTSELRGGKAYHRHGELPY